MTTPENITDAKRIAKEISAVAGVSSCIADDWGNDGNFSLIATLDLGEYLRSFHRRGFPSSTSNLRKISWGVRKFLKGYNYKIDSPTRKYETSDGIKYFAGYDKDYIQIHLWLME